MTDTFTRHPASSIATGDKALLDILEALKTAQYHFVTPTPSTHALVSGRHRRARPRSLRDIFGWCQAFRPDDLDDALVRALETADALSMEDDGLLRSKVRASSVDDVLYIHSAPNDDRDAVFLGPDSYRFARLLKANRGANVGRAIDIGTGAGVGALTLAELYPDAEIWGGDVNPKALRFAGVNALHAGRPLHTVLAPGLSGAKGLFDLIVANPPYIAGSGGRTYRDGGEDLGAELALEWASAALGRLAPSGRMILYTGSPISDGVDPVERELLALASNTGFALTYEELDPDVFGGTLRQNAYRNVDRIAAVGAVLQAPRQTLPR